ncbi:FeoB-associated Cys-rich membrane protein [Elizabethkingia sp. JS20170427COW]|nr:FeoB-associated Cys-rich membrane protein [Elizabethkingia sp. JS20170427COW]
MDTIQYIIVGVLVIFAAYNIFKVFKKTFSKNKKGGCDKDCCS